MANEGLFGLLLIMTCAGALGGVFFKMYSQGKNKLKLLLGLGCYGFGALLNIYLLGKLPYTVVLPANALTYVWALGFARWIFKETVALRQTAGVAVILAGLLLLVL